MTVHIAGSTPPDELNGLPAITQALIDGRFRGDTHLVVGAVQVSGAKETAKNKFELEPIVAFSQIETVPDEMRDQVVELLHALRSARSGKTTLDFPKDEKPPVVPEPLALSATAGEYKVEIVDETPGVFGIRVVTESGARVAERHSLPRTLYGELPPASYYLWALTDEIQDLAESLIAEFEAGTYVPGADHSEEPVDAEVIDDEDYDVAFFDAAEGVDD